MWKYAHRNDERNSRHHFLYKINKNVDWDKLREIITGRYKENKDTTENPTYDLIMLFKILLLEQWYHLSDDQAEMYINDSFLFSTFIELDLSAPAPDHSTICRFRNELNKLKLWDELLDALNRQLAEHGILRIKGGEWGDATIVNSQNNPHCTNILEIAGDREDERSEAQKQQENNYHQ